MHEIGHRYPESVTNISNLSPTHLVSNIRHQHLCNPHDLWAHPILELKKDSFTNIDLKMVWMNKNEKCWYFQACFLEVKNVELVVEKCLTGFGTRWQTYSTDLKSICTSHFCCWNYRNYSLKDSIEFKSLIKTLTFCKFNVWRSKSKCFRICYIVFINSWF